MKAIFPGSFNPFTIGHLDILARALPAFEEVIIAIGLNIDKQLSASAQANADYLSSLFIGCPKIKVVCYSRLTIDLAMELGASVIIRGFRNAADADYERSLAATNLMLSKGKIDTWLIPSRPELECISSSMVRELRRFGHDVSPYLPNHRQCLEALQQPES